MSVLPPEVLNEFQEGNCVIKHTDQRFSQVSAGQSTEWLNAIGKKCGGLVGISTQQMDIVVQSENSHSFPDNSNAKTDNGR